MAWHRQCHPISRLPRSKVLERTGNLIDDDIDLLTEQIIQRRRGTGVRNDGEVDTQRFLQKKSMAMWLVMPLPGVA